MLSDVTVTASLSKSIKEGQGSRFFRYGTYVFKSKLRSNGDLDGHPSNLKSRRPPTPFSRRRHRGHLPDHSIGRQGC
jgi:hypothetical protein